MRLPRALWIAAAVAALTGCTARDSNPVSDDDDDLASPTPVQGDFHWEAGGYSVPAQSESYHCWFVNVPTGGTTADPTGATRYAYTAGAAGVMHHLVVFSSSNAEPDGQRECEAMETGWTIRYAGGMNTDPLETPAGVAVTLDPVETFVIQIHYLNAGDAAAGDDTVLDVEFTDPGAAFIRAGVLMSGVSIFDVPPQVTAWTTSGTCWIPPLSPPIQVYAIFPHMHRHGTRFQIEHERAGTATVDVLLDQPWNFGDQSLVRPSPFIPVKEGDRIATTCTFYNDTDVPIAHGESSNQEMCFDFFFYYPAIVGDMLPCLDS